MATEQKQEQKERDETREDLELFEDKDLSGYRGRWDEIQTGFVDEPKQAVEQADELVADLVRQITSSFSESRSKLESQWSEGEEASTEDLRVALTQYRTFFNRLLKA
jgi:hypothetical protein